MANSKFHKKIISVRSIVTGICLLLTAHSFSFASDTPKVAELSHSKQAELNRQIQLNKWHGFDYQEMGLTQKEFQKIKEVDMTKELLFHLLEIGIYPGEYFKEPWIKLGVDEETWIEERAEGMSDEDIDRSFDLSTKGEAWAFSSAVFPSYYQYKTDQMHKAVAINIWTLGTLGGYTWMQVDGISKNRQNLLYLAFLGNFYSFLDGFLDNKESTDPDIGLSLWKPGESFPSVSILWRF